MPLEYLFRVVGRKVYVRYVQVTYMVGYTQKYVSKFNTKEVLGKVLELFAKNKSLNRNILFILV